MAIVEAAFKALETNVDDDGNLHPIKQDKTNANYPEMGKRRNRDWATVIGTIRKLEQQENESRSDSLGRIEKLTADMSGWMERAHLAERDLEQLRLKVKIMEGDFSDKDSKYLLEAATA